MRKVKVMMISVLVLAVVGGILAFKAKKQSDCMFITTINVDPCVARTCLLQVGIKPNPVPNGITVRFQLTPANFDCAHPAMTATDCRLCDLIYTQVGL